jgi:hypothetical protein
MLVVWTAPLIPIGAAQAGRGIARRRALIGVLGSVCVFVAAVFGLLGAALLVAATGVTEWGDEASSLWLAGGIWFISVAGLLVVVRRRLSRRYPSEPWHPSDRSTSAG